MYVFFCRCCILKCKYILRGKGQADWSLVNWVVVPSSRLNYLRASLQYTPFQSDDTKQVEREAAEAEAGDLRISAQLFHGSTADAKVWLCERPRPSPQQSKSPRTPLIQ